MHGGLVKIHGNVWVHMYNSPLLFLSQKYREYSDLSRRRSCAMSAQIEVVRCEPIGIYNYMLIGY